MAVRSQLSVMRRDAYFIVRGCFFSVYALVHLLYISAARGRACADMQPYINEIVLHLPDICWHGGLVSHLLIK